MMAENNRFCPKYCCHCEARGQLTFGQGQIQLLERTSQISSGLDRSRIYFNIGEVLFY